MDVEEVMECLQDIESESESDMVKQTLQLRSLRETPQRMRPLS